MFDAARGLRTEAEREAITLQQSLDEKMATPAGFEPTTTSLEG
jgi:hypothetical protein